MRLSSLIISLLLLLTSCKTGSKDLTTVPDQSMQESQSFEMKNILFDYDSSLITTSSMETLQALSEYLKKSPEKKIQISGHCDERGSSEYNLALGEKRASSVKKALVSLGVSEAQLITISFGEEKPAVSESNEEAYKLNRRAEFMEI